MWRLPVSVSSLLLVRGHCRVSIATRSPAQFLAAQKAFKVQTCHAVPASITFMSLASGISKQSHTSTRVSGPLWHEMASQETHTEVPKPNTRVVRHHSVEGFNSQTNDVLYCKTSSGEAKGHLIFFGGDVQDYPENMMAHRDNQHYVMWNLENTAELLSNRFPYHHVWIIKPCKMDFKTFSVYSNFVEFTDIGNPENYEGQSSWQHLKALMDNAFKLSHSSPDADACHSTELLPITLAGFSKGCVVLNQLVYDLGEAKENPDTSPMVKRVSEMYWLDGGHNGGGKTWVEDVEVLKYLSDTGITIYCHVTPYQVKDPMRKWLGKEQKRFVERTRKLGLTVHNTVHFAEDERSIENHFKVLTVF